MCGGHSVTEETVGRSKVACGEILGRQRSSQKYSSTRRTTVLQCKREPQIKGWGLVAQEDRRPRRQRLHRPRDREKGEGGKEFQLLEVKVFLSS